MEKDFLLGIILGGSFGFMGFLVRRILKQRFYEHFIPFFIVLYAGKFILMVAVLFLTLRFISSNNFMCLSSFLAAFTFWKFFEVYSIYKDSLKVI